MKLRRIRYSGTTAIAMAFTLAWLPYGRTTALELQTGAGATDRPQREAPELRGVDSAGSHRDSAGSPSPGSVAVTPRVMKAQLETARKTLSAQREVLDRILGEPRFAGTRGDKLRGVRARLDKRVLYLEIALSSGERRHELIRQLPVTITATKAVEEGRSGSYREYIAKSKVRARVFVPDHAGRAVASEPADQGLEQPDGSASADHRPSADCDYEDEDGAFSGTCVTQQDIDDAFIVEADLIAGEGQVEADAQDAYNDIDSWCQQNHPSCGGEDGHHCFPVPALSEAKVRWSAWPQA